MIRNIAPQNLPSFDGEFCIPQKNCAAKPLFRRFRYDLLGGGTRKSGLQLSSASLEGRFKIESAPQTDIYKMRIQQHP
ncbi:hypothetical protein ABKN59_003579 [Abortiporus biennis]